MAVSSSLQYEILHSINILNLNQSLNYLQVTLFVFLEVHFIHMVNKLLTLRLFEYKP